MSGDLCLSDVLFVSFLSVRLLLPCDCLLCAILGNIVLSVCCLLFLRVLYYCLSVLLCCQFAVVRFVFLVVVRGVVSFCQCSCLFCPVWCAGSSLSLLVVCVVLLVRRFCWFV